MQDYKTTATCSTRTITAQREISERHAATTEKGKELQIDDHPLAIIKLSSRQKLMATAKYVRANSSPSQRREAPLGEGY